MLYIDTFIEISRGKVNISMKFSMAETQTWNLWQDRQALYR